MYFYCLAIKMFIRHFSADRLPRTWLSNRGASPLAIHSYVLVLHHQSGEAQYTEAPGENQAHLLTRARRSTVRLPVCHIHV